MLKIPPVDAYGTANMPSAPIAGSASHFQPRLTHRLMPKAMISSDSVIAGIGRMRVPMPISASGLQAV